MQASPGGATANKALAAGELTRYRASARASRQRHSLWRLRTLEVSLATRSMMLVPQHATLSGRIAADHMQLECHQQFSSSRPVARRASLKVSAFESQTQPWKKSSSSSSSRGTATVGRSATLTVEAAKTQQFTSFEEMVRGSEVPVLVDFHAQWCGPCKLMGDSLRGIADEMKGKVSVVKIDTDKYPNIASRYGIKSLPTLLLFRDGRAVDRIEGLLPEASLAQRLRFYIGRLDLKFGRR
ncbi:g4153 [Coccomyxa viridis]|uniref:G4153 protein n=1 Tax=Coccomyxa viridis TaxID=1274662 RepID=A0ABP1FPM5_9CHLO